MTELLLKTTHCRDKVPDKQQPTKKGLMLAGGLRVQSAMSGKGMVWEGEEFLAGAVRNTRLLCSQIDKEHGTHRDYKTSRSALHSSP